MEFPLCGMKSFHYLYTQIAGRQQQFQWQVNLRVTLVFVRVLQFADAHGAEYLVWRAEARHQILKRPRIQPQ